MKHSFPIGNIAHENQLVEVGSTTRNNSNDEQKRLRPSIECTTEILFAADRINNACFGGRLDEFIISCIRKNNVPSHFQPNRFQRAGGGSCHGLAFNSLHLGLRTQTESLTTIGYECARVFRYDFGPLNQSGGKGSNGYHDKPLAMLAKSIGLQLSDTGLPGGKTTGSKMSYYLIEDGLLAKVIAELLDSGFRINWHDRVVFQNHGATEIDEEEVPAPKRDRVKFTCPKCGLNAWAKPSARLTCTDCKLPMHSPDAVTNILTTTQQKEDAHGSI